MSKDEINALHQRLLHDVLVVNDLEVCWYWRGSLTQGGYGQFHLDRKKWLAHRASYVLFKGEIPKGKFVLHDCHVRKCVNPDHLHVDTAQNTDEMIAAGRRVTMRGMQNKMATITEQQANEILWLALNCPWLTFSQIGERYGTATSTINNIKHRRKWRHLVPLQPKDWPWKTSSGSFKRRI
jgi:hypothetical protein